MSQELLTKLQTYQAANLPSCKLTKLQTYQAANLPSCKLTKLQTYQLKILLP